MPPKRMTANPSRPARYRPGKALEEQVSSDEEEEDLESEEETLEPAPKPKATSFPSETKISADLKKVDLQERRRQGEEAEAARIAEAKALQAAEEEGFETEESEEEDSGSEESSDEESSSEEEAPRRQLLRPTFIKKNKRDLLQSNDSNGKSEEELFAEREAARRAAASEQVQEQLRRDAAAKAAGKKNWDDEEVADIDAVDDTDGLNPEAEYAAWKLRELKRIHRDRETIEQAEKEREEVERRRNLSKEEREAEDREFIARQKEELSQKGKMAFLQKYHHKGAFYQEEMQERGLAERDIMGSRFEGEVDRETLPEYMQIRDMNKLGRKGRTKYRDLRTEDTGRWGVVDKDPRFSSNRPDVFSKDERFQPDRLERGPQGPTGANASVVRPRVDGAPTGPRQDRGGRDNRSRSPSRDPDRKRRQSPSLEERHDKEKRPRVSATS